MLRVAITGAAGFVPASLARALRAGGDEVLCWVRPGADTWRLGDGARLLGLDVRRCLQADGRAEAVAALRGFGAEVLVHGAWTGIRGEARDDPRQAENVAVTAELVLLAAEAGVRRVVGLGSQAEYGAQPGPVTEASPALPTSMYGASKLAAGHLLLALARRLGLSGAWARIFSVYGPGERSGTLIPDLTRALAERRPLPLGDGLRRWDYLYEDDAGAALAALVRAGAAEGIFNVASGRPILLREAMELVAASVGSGARPLLGVRPAAQGEATDLEADIGRIAAATGWRPAIPLEEGIARTVDALLGREPAARAPGPGVARG